MGPPLDLGDAASVRSFASAEGGAGRPLHVLVNNAGASYLPRGRTGDGFCTLAQVLPAPCLVGHPQTDLMSDQCFKGLLAHWCMHAVFCSEETPTISI